MSHDVAVPSNAQARTQKFLLIWKSLSGRVSYYRLLVETGHPVAKALQTANGLSLTDQAVAEQAQAIQAVWAYLKDSGKAVPIAEHQLCGHMGWDRVYVVG